ncbi:MAG: HD domain-containing protein [Simkaniaceae bacterium]|nr:HD domain-containing protein [Simkaniaceae bacterium]
MGFKKLNKIISIISLAENLKRELRHCWYEDGRRESVAEHTWRMSLMAMLLAPELEKPIDLERVLKMIIVHDLIEAITGDIPAFDVNTPEKKAQKSADERAAMETIRKTLDSTTGNDLFHLWEEYEKGSTYNARFAKAIDKLEANIQHNEASIDSWTECDQEWTFAIDDYCTIDPILETLCDHVRNTGVAKMIKAGIDVTKVAMRCGYQKPLTLFENLQETSNNDLADECLLDSEPEATA